MVLWYHILTVKYSSGVSLTSDKSIKPPVNGEKCSGLVIWSNGTDNFGMVCESSSPDSEDITMVSLSPELWLSMEQSVSLPSSDFVDTNGSSPSLSTS